MSSQECTVGERVLLKIAVQANTPEGEYLNAWKGKFVFDAEAFEPTQLNGKWFYQDSHFTYKNYFATKPDGTNWTSITIGSTTNHIIRPELDTTDWK